jgi:hypothetical protein
MGAPGIIAGAGLGLQIYSMVSGANAQADAAERDAADKRLQADEIERRAIVREQFMRLESQRTIGAGVQKTAAMGWDVSGAPLLALEQAHAGMMQEIVEMRREALFQATQLRRGGDIQDDLAGSRRLTGWLSAGGQLLQGVGKWPGLFDGNNGGAQDLGDT